MKPVNRGGTVTGLADHKAAKPQLIERLGPFCSYCEQGAAPQDLDVEHIYPQMAHPKRAKNWRNFLLSCGTCNIYKRQHIGDGRQSSLLTAFAWPHIDNTFRAFEYLPDGRVEVVVQGTTAVQQQLATDTREMVGLMKVPQVAQSYVTSRVAYDGIRKREEIYGEANIALGLWQRNPSPDQQASILATAKRGYFSIWMNVFVTQPTMRRAFIDLFRADPACFDASTAPLPKGRI